MSHTRVVTGLDDRGRPKSEWRPTAGMDAEPRYGFMEPAHSAPIERRRATPAELEAARAREEEPSHLVAPTIAKPPTVVVSTISQESRLRGGAVTADLHRKPDAPRTAASYRPNPPREEPAVSEAPADIPQEVRPPRANASNGLSPFAVLDDAVAAAAQAWTAKLEADRQAELADVEWRAARRALDSAYRGLDEPQTPDGPDRVYDAPMVSTSPDAYSPVIEPSSAIGGGPAHPTKQDQTLDAVLRHRGDLKAVAEELHTTAGNVGATLHNAGKRHRLTVAHIAVLPASFAKYASL